MYPAPYTSGETFEYTKTTTVLPPIIANDGPMVPTFTQPVPPMGVMGPMGYPPYGYPPPPPPQVMMMEQQRMAMAQQQGYQNGAASALALCCCLQLLCCLL